MQQQRGLVVDLFAGGGGASEGLARAIGRDPDIAINHDAAALAMHEANHPGSRHYREDVFDVDPAEVCGGRPVSLLWASPDCKHFSKAKGGKPLDKNIRGLAWVAVLWAATVEPDVILVENVEEFQKWGPLDRHDRPIKSRAGETFREWWGCLEALGYRIEKRELRAADYGAPTIRKRLFIVARRDGQPIVWPDATHGPVKPGEMPGLQTLEPYRTAAECIDWSLPCPSIFDRRKPLAEATLRRIARGIQRYVIDAERPFIVSLTHQGGDRVEDVAQPFTTITGANRGEKALVTPYLAGVGGRAGQSRPRGIDEPTATSTAKADTVLVTPTLVGITHNKSGDHITDRTDQPMRTITTSRGGEMAVVTPFLARTAYKGANGSYVNDVQEPVRTITAQQDGLSVVEPVLAPFIAPASHGASGERPDMRSNSAEEPLRTIITRGAPFHVVAPAIVRMNHDGQGKPADAVDEPLRTVTTQHNHLNVAAAFLAKHNGGHEATGSDLEEPVHTVTAQDHHALVAGSLTKLYGTSEAGAPVDEPAPTITSGGQHIGAVYAFLTSYYGNEKDGTPVDQPARTVTTKDRMALVYVEGEPYAIVDIGMRMLEPEELFRAQGFPEDYVLDVEYEATDARGRVRRKRLTKTDKIRMCGNSVCPPVAEALVTANYRPAAFDGAEAAS